MGLRRPYANIDFVLPVGVHLGDIGSGFIRSNLIWWCDGDGRGGLSMTMSLMAWEDKPHFGRGKGRLMDASSLRATKMNTLALKAETMAERRRYDVV